MVHPTARTAALAAIALLASTGTAPARTGVAAACPEQPTSHPFERWGDTAEYVHVPGGAFDGTLSWAASGGAALVAEEDPYGVGGPGAGSVRLPRGAAIVSPVLCVSRAQPHLRFLARASGRRDRLRLEVLWVDDKGKARVAGLGDHDGDRFEGWQPSRDVQLKKVLPSDPDVARDVRLRFEVREPGTWLVDDVFIDPLKRG